MGPKFLFVMGIVLAHGVLGVILIRGEEPQQRNTLATCVNAPLPMPDFQPRRELLAMQVASLNHEDLAQP
jgi:hypothetical protein